MKTTYRGLAIAALGAVVAGGAYAQSYASFTASEITGVLVTNPVSGDATKFNIKLFGGATVTFGGNTYPVTQVFAFFVMRSPSASPVLATGTDQGNWSWKGSTGGGGEIRGWTANANGDRLNAGDDVTLDFLTVQNDQIEDYGFHLTYLDGRDVKTAYFKDPDPVPEPFTMGLAALGLAAAIRKRRRKS